MIGPDEWAIYVDLIEITIRMRFWTTPNTNPKYCLSRSFTYRHGRCFHSIVTRAYTSRLAQLALFLFRIHIHVYGTYRGAGKWEYGHPYALRTSDLATRIATLEALDSVVAGSLWVRLGKREEADAATV